ncbi:MAG: stalk domain-containing protein [Candidatus Cohnella colombiensis]|uniref:Stalk domain-containing protein n=1 Tax=Candidatus Cohnella colombiensis TaxID=3121368 RepID=A0AA95EWN5_9BACL|nr:MAG: stalk domain-containing protein [Cohnella sp.]
MKKKLLLSLLIIGMLASASIGAYAATKMTLIVNGAKADVDPVVIKGVTYVPVRAAAQMLGADVKYDASTGTVTVTSKGSSPTQSTSAKKSYSVDIVVNSGPMILKISKVTLDPTYKANDYSAPIKAVVFDVSAENTTSETVHWYPSHGEIVTNTKEQARHSSDTNMINGEFKGKVIQSGKAVFEIKGDLTAITSMNYFIDAPFKVSLGDVGGKDEVIEIVLQ